MISNLSPDFSDLPGRRAVPRNYHRGQSVVTHIDVSIVTPYYNTEDFFVETFVALQAQSLQNWEWVIVDDGSSDADSLARLAHVAQTDNRVKVIHQTNAGPGAARNTSFKHTQGRYVCLLDSDDMLEPTYLEKCVWFLDSNPEFSFCNSYSVVFGEQEYLWTTGFERGVAHLQANSGPPISVIRRAAYADAGGFDESIRFGHEDWDFWLAMAKAGHWGYTLREYLQWYRKRGNGRFEQIMRSGNVNDEFEKLIHRKYEGLEKSFPNPQRSHPSPYETLETAHPVSNPLQRNASGRRILFLLPWMVTGGADRVNLDLVEGLVARGHDITICATLVADHQWEDQFSRFTPDIFVLPNILRPADYPRFLAYLIASRQIDTVVVTGSTLGYHMLPYLRAVSPGVAFVDMCHVEEPHWLNGGHPRFGVGYQEALDLNIVTTRHLAQWMQASGADATRIRVMYTGIRSVQTAHRAELRAQIRRELGIAEAMPIIVFAGRICAQKRPAVLAEILKQARDQGLVFQALIIGNGELKLTFEGLLKQHSLLAHVTMLGSVSHHRWLNILVAADIFLMPSQYEGISIALLEAMAAGVVPVVAKVGGQEEIVAADAGVLVAHSAHEVSDYLQALTELLSGTGQRQRMSQQCQVLAASKLSWQAMTDRFEAILTEAHQLRVTQPRHPISPALGKEFASLSLEYKRLGEAVDWLWTTRPHSASGQSPTLPTAADSQAIVIFAVLLSQTRVVRLLLGSPFLRKCAKWLVKKMT